MRSNLPSHLDPHHPVLMQEYAVFTPPVHAMAQKIGDWIDQRQPGGYIHGPSRFGKSRGVKWHMKAVLEDRFGKRIPLHIWSRPLMATQIPPLVATPNSSTRRAA